MPEQSGKPGIIVLGPKVPEMVEPLRAFAEPLPLWQYGTVKDCVNACSNEVRGVVATGESVVPRSFIDELPSLGIIACFGVGYDGIDVSAASGRGIRVTNTPDVLTDDVADMAVGFAIALRRRFLEADRYVREGRWEMEGPMPFTDRFHGKKIGIAGLGRVGKVVAQRLEVFRCEIGYYDIARFDVPYEFYSDLVSLANESDVLIVTMPGGEKTRQAISRDVIEALGPQGYLVNVSRGSVVDERGLVESLEKGRIAGAALDVFADEPNVPQELKKMSNVILSPHTASGTWETRNAMRDLVVENLKLHFENREPRTPIN